MSVLEVVESAIRLRSPLTFQYLRPGKTLELRIGNPHAAFIRRRKSDGVEQVYLHLWQTEGATDSSQELPSWRQFLLNDIANPEMRSGGAPFEIAEGYNPASYEQPIAKV